MHQINIQLKAILNKLKNITIFSLPARKIIKKASIWYSYVKLGFSFKLHVNSSSEHPGGIPPQQIGQSKLSQSVGNIFSF